MDVRARYETARGGVLRVQVRVGGTGTAAGFFARFFKRVTVELCVYRDRGNGFSEIPSFPVSIRHCRKPPRIERAFFFFFFSLLITHTRTSATEHGIALGTRR